MKKTLWLITLLVTMGHASAAKKSEAQASAFQKIYSSTCLQYLTHLDDLRAKLVDLPAFPPEQAEKFLQGKQGKAWPIPGQPGEFVLMLEDGKDFCAVYARKLDTQIATDQFVAIYQKPILEDFVAEKVLDEKKNARHSISYNWFLPNTQRKLNFMLTVSDAKSSPVQALFTAAIIAEK